MAAVLKLVLLLLRLLWLLLLRLRLVAARALFWFAVPSAAVHRKRNRSWRISATEPPRIDSRSGVRVWPNCTSARCLQEERARSWLLVVRDLCLLGCVFPIVETGRHWRMRLERRRIHFGPVVLEERERPREKKHWWLERARPQDHFGLVCVEERERSPRVEERERSHLQERERPQEVVALQERKCSQEGILPERRRSQEEDVASP